MDHEVIAMILAEPATRQWTREEYYRLAEQGWFEGQRVQLIDGEIHRSPVADPSAEFGWRHEDTTVVEEEGEFAPLARANVEIRPGDLLP
jgi:hypothetical protein